MTASLVSHFALAGIGSLAFTALTPQATLAAPGITLKGSFDGTNGGLPYAALTSAGNGKFYGTTSAGGANGNGAIFEFDSGNGSIILRGSFDGANGSSPSAALTSAGSGIFYGTTANGGVNNAGTIFLFNSNTGSISREKNLDEIGANSYAALTSAGSGIFYGTTANGGANNAGTIFEFNSNTGSISRKGSFDNTTAGIGANPYAALTSAGNGIFYGTTLNGGANNAGTIFEFNSNTGSISRRGSFDNTTAGIGANPYAALTSAGNGKFYGTTSAGGANNKGTIFEFDPSGSGSITLKSSFNNTNGATPNAALTSAGNGKFYGTTQLGGDNDLGAVFEFDPSGSGSITLKSSFDFANGALPYAALTSAGNGKFYGTTAYGGSNSVGTIFEFNSGANNVPTPSPLPVIGAGAAFGWSRRLRRRIQQARPVVPMGR